MKTTLLIAWECLLLGSTAIAQQKDTVYVSDFGAQPYSYKNCVTKLQDAIAECKRSGAKVLSFNNGRYDIWPEGATQKEYFISNTSTEEECPSKVKTIGLLFDGLKNLTICGNGATLMFHGKMITVALEHCENMKLQDLHIDFERPAGSELTYTRVSEGEAEVTMHPDTRYEIINGRINLYGEGWRSNINHCIQYDPQEETFKYCNDWNTLAVSNATEISRGKVSFITPAGFLPKVGNTLTIRDIIRDQVGMFILESRNTTLSRVQMHYMHGLGIVSQYSHNITMDRVKCMPRPGNGRLLAASADMMHFSGCSGKVKVDSCYYAGAQDDPINVHGTNLRAVEKVDARTLRLRFMHGQSYGYNAFFKGDTVAFVQASTMLRTSQAKIEKVTRISNRIVEVGFDREIPATLELNHDCVENITCTPEVEIRNSYFTRTSTRGTLVTTPRKVVIENNTYYKTGMSAILIEGDAEGWYESGPVCDVLIKGNTFIDCAYSGGPHNAVIALHPSNTVVNAKHPVHRNVRMEGNTFKTLADYPALYAKSTGGLHFTGNTIISTHLVADKEKAVQLEGCKDVTIRNNKFRNR